MLYCAILVGIKYLPKLSSPITGIISIARQSQNVISIGFVRLRIADTLSSTFSISLPVTLDTT